MRPFLPATLLCCLLTGPATALADDLEATLREVARNSSVGTPRAMNADIVDYGYSAQGHRLINHLKVRPSHAVQMRMNIDAVRQQLKASVCRNAGFRRLMSQGAMLVYDFVEAGNPPRMVTIEYFRAEDCQR